MLFSIHSYKLQPFHHCPSAATPSPHIPLPPCTWFGCWDLQSQGSRNTPDPLLARGTSPSARGDEVSKVGSTALAFLKASCLPAPALVSGAQGLAELCVSLPNINLHPALRYHLRRPEGSSNEGGRTLGEMGWASSRAQVLSSLHCFLCQGVKLRKIWSGKSEALFSAKERNSC